jgi:hypothetical protein
VSYRDVHSYVSSEKELFLVSKGVYCSPETQKTVDLWTGHGAQTHETNLDSCTHVTFPPSIPSVNHPEMPSKTSQPSQNPSPFPPSFTFHPRPNVPPSPPAFIAPNHPRPFERNRTEYSGLLSQYPDSLIILYTLQELEQPPGVFVKPRPFRQLISREPSYRSYSSSHSCRVARSSASVALVP